MLCWNLLCSPNWPQIQGDLPTSASPVMKLKVCTNTTSLNFLNFEIVTKSSIQRILFLYHKDLLLVNLCLNIIGCHPKDVGVGKF